MYTCTTCKLQYYSKSGFNAHIRTKHGRAIKTYICNTCNKSFLRKIDLIKHVKNEMTQIGKIICSFTNCDKSFKLLRSYQLHLKITHMVDIMDDTLHFNTVEEFNEWKYKMEETENCQFVQTSKKCSNNVEYSYYYCQRSFYPRSSSNGKRSVKNGGSVKNGKICPSYIKVHKKDSKLRVQYCSTHLWHNNDIGRLRLNTDDRAKLAGKLALGVPVQRLINDFRDSVDGTNLKRIHLIKKRDYHINNYSIIRHENDFISVSLWVEQMRKKGEKNPVLFFKHQGQNDSTHLLKDDFCLIIMTECQAEMLLKFGCDKVCVDGTHGLYNYNFELYTLLVVDEYGDGFPVAFCFSNKSDTPLYTLFFEYVKKNVGKIESSVFMSDDEPAFYNAWSSVMGPVSKQFLCTWHVLRNWNKNLSKIKTNEKKTIVLKTLKALLYETEEKAFHIELTKLLSDLKNDVDTVDFGNYFATTYSSRIEKWAFNRKYFGINTNMYLEALHKSIKYCFLEGKQCRRVDLSINALMLLVRDKYFDRVIKISKERISSKIVKIIASHNKSKNILTEMILEIEHNKWIVTSKTDENLRYLVEKIDTTCNGCILRCNSCNICVHTFKCTCTDSVIYFNICKHIHAIANSNKLININEQNNATLPVINRSIILGRTVEPLSSPSLSEEIQKKMEIMLGMHNWSTLNETSQSQILKHCDKIISILSNESGLVPNETAVVNITKNIDEQSSFVSKKKQISSNFLQISSSESQLIRESLHDSTSEVLNVHSSNDHTYAFKRM